MSVLSLTLMRPKLFHKSLHQLERQLLKCYGTQVAVDVKDPKDELMKEFERLSNITIKHRTKKPHKPPFMKNVFLGIFDTDVLTYPQLEKDELDSLNKELEPVVRFFKEVLPQEKPPDIASDFMENMRKLRLFGLQGPQLLDGRECNITESCRFTDVIASDTSVAPGLIHNDQLGIQTIMKFGTDEQKKKYLPQLLSGSKLCAFCLAEDNMTDLSSMKTVAKLTDDWKTWELNGKKLFVVNGSNADLLLVAAKTEVISKVGIKENSSSIVLVDRELGGIITYPCDTLGLQGTDISNVIFRNIRLSSDNILGKLESAEEVTGSLLTEFRLSSGTACAAILRKLSENLIRYCVDTTCNNCSIAEGDYVRGLMGEITMKLYAIESMNYLTAGLLDQYEDQDCLMESAIVKAFSASETCNLISKAMQLIGSPAYLKNHWCNVLHRDALSYLLLNETSENLKLNVALMGLQHTGSGLQEYIKLIRNPLFNPFHTLKRMWSHRRQGADNPKLTLHLSDYLHPSAVYGAECLEYSVLRVQFAAEILLSRYGPEVINKHLELKRLADSVFDIYAMTASLGRASRSYCIGLQHADLEMILASTFCLDAMHRVRKNVLDIYNGPAACNDDQYKKAAKRVFKFGEYFPRHPLTRNF